MKINVLIFLMLLQGVMLSAQSPLKKITHTDTKQAILDKAYDYMSNDQYDSAQYYLNKIYSKESSRKPTIFNYYLTTCQAEIYYYNNLHLLGLQESLKGETIAKILKDSVLLADSYNFIGLFHLNGDKFQQAKLYFKKSLRYASQPPYKKSYNDLSKPHHILGNLAETYERLKLPDSAIFFSLLSLEKAKEIKSGRGMATGALNIGNAYLLNAQVDSAFKYFDLTKRYAIEANEFDVELTGCSGMAECKAQQHNKVQAFKYLEDGFAVLKKYPQLNDFYAAMFLEVAIKLYRKYGDVQLLNRTLELKSKRETATYNRNNRQIQSLLLTGINNEKTIFELELKESKNQQSLANTRIYILLLVLSLLVIAFLAYRYYTLQRLRLANVRSKISQDLHDEVGATLSGIAMYSYITKEQLKNNQEEQVIQSLDIIKDNAAEMVSKLNDIVWTVNPVQDNLQGLVERLKEFAVQTTNAKQIVLSFSTSGNLEEVKLPMEARKNIYLICKEATNNAVKYSEGKILTVKLEVKQKMHLIKIEDNGIGFLPEEENKGNGLLNMTNRAKEINAQLTISSRPSQGTIITLAYKFTKLKVK
ncbi:MAG: hypothetical protein EOO07_11120 [Chitinophagaceae bacterium]|nr:MAG: hypothetical protein EOO07_11120 [Chitinophagaceae bacterium]